MRNVICPNCRTVVPPALCCLNCNVQLPAESESAAATARSSGRARSRDPGTDQIQIDSHLRKAALRTRDLNAVKLASPSVAQGEESVIALVKSVKALKAADGFRVISTIKPIGDGDPTTIVTARIPSNKIDDLRDDPNIVSLKASRLLRPQLEKTVEEIGIPRGNPHAGDGGSGVIIGIIDFGLDFMHRNFRNADGSTRVLAIWDQTAPRTTRSPKPYGYGRVYTKEQIDKAIKSKQPYKKLRYGPPRDNLVQIGAHGTYVTDVAAGNGNGSGAAGVAPGAHIVFVEASTVGVSCADSQVIGNTFGDCAQLIEAIKFIFDFADKRGLPCVINVSLGTGGGPHDGTTIVEMAMDRMVKQAHGRAIVVAASNLSGKKLHATGQVSAEKPADIKWQIFPGDSSDNELEVWYPKEDRFEVELINPKGVSLARVKYGYTEEMEFDSSQKPGEKAKVVVVNRKNDPINGDNTINIYFECDVLDGLWTIRLHATAAGNGAFHAWIERDETGQSRLEGSDSVTVNDDCTLSSIACGKATITVGAYDAHEEGFPLSEFTAKGGTRDGRKKPEISAPGEEVLAAYSGSLVRRNRLSGTSMSAPAVAGVVALMMSAAKGRKLTADEIRQILIKTARRNPPDKYDDEGWHPQYGFGRVSADKAVAVVADLKS